MAQDFKKGYDERRNYDGRPTKYKESFVQEVDKYLEKKHDEYIVQNDREKLKVKLPTIEDFAFNHLGVHHSTVWDWGKKYPQFSKALDKIREEQRQRLLEKGLSNDYNSTIAKLILSSNHGMKERQDVTSGDEPLPENKIQFVDFSEDAEDK